MASALSDLADKHTEEIHKIKCKYGYDNKKCETGGVKNKDCKCCLEYTNVQDNFVEQKCLFCNWNYQTFNENVKKRFATTYKFYNHDTNIFILLLQKGVYPSEYMNDWEKHNEITLP